MTGRLGSVLFLAKADDVHVERALAFLRDSATHVTVHLGKWGDKLPNLEDWRGEYIISYLSRWVLPEWLLQRASIAAINFHPAPPEYPGYGCTNFALYDNSPFYGTTCHHMAAKVDTGAIVAVKRFPIFDSDTVASVQARTYDYQLTLFYEMVSLMRAGKPLPQSEEKWTRRPYTRRELDELSVITPDMSAAEVARRVRATSFGPWQPTLQVHGFVFKLDPTRKQS